MIIILSILSIIAMFTFGFVIGYKLGEADGETRVLNQIDDYFRRYDRGGVK